MKISSQLLVVLLLSALLAFILVEEVVALGVRNNNTSTSFDHNYYVTWGSDHVLFLNQGRQVQLSMDNSSGAGFQSKLSYTSGFFRLRIKLPDRDSAGVVTAFYLTSFSKKHDELDFEFLGNREGKPYTLQTNVFSNGQGGREQRTHLWFDPTADFHTYGILWNQHQIVFYVDKIPIRVYKNKTNIGVSYPTQPMQLEISLWDGDNWATDGGQTKTNWSHAPFKAHFQRFNIDGCSSDHTTYDANNDDSNISSTDHDHDHEEACYSSNYWWNRDKYWKLSSAQQTVYEDVRDKYMNYDYCSDKGRFPTPPHECPQ